MPLKKRKQAVRNTVQVLEGQVFVFLKGVQTRQG